MDHFEVLLSTHFGGLFRIGHFKALKRPLYPAVVKSGQKGGPKVQKGLKKEVQKEVKKRSF
jgi:hypothetical protein